jgi:hypothetical protein
MDKREECCVKNSIYSRVQLCQKLNLQPGTKASIQWERIFKSEARQKRLGIDKLTEREKKVLEVYLLEHAADSAHPMVPGL